MMHFDVVVIGSGPAGQKAAVQAAKSGNKVCIVEQELHVGGSAINRGTLPSKALRENAMRILHLKQNAQLFKNVSLVELDMAVLVNRMEEVLTTHDRTIESQTDRNLISRMPGRASITSRYEIHVERVKGKAVDLQARVVVLASGSLPDIPEHIPVDHENIFDAESILNMLYLPQSLTVIGSDMHACEYATIFQTLGVKVTLIDVEELPLAGFDLELRTQLKASFEALGGKWIGNAVVESCEWDGVAHVVTTLASGEQIVADKLMCAPRRKANIQHLKLDQVEVELTDDGFVKVNELLQTSVPNIFAAGDIIGPPALASTAMEQGRRAICNALRIPIDKLSELIPKGVYSIPEISTVGLTQAEALQQHKTVIVGRANFSEIVRGQISGHHEGFLKIVCDSAGKKVLGVQILGEGATELIHIGQLAILNGNTVDTFIDTVFNFPTLAEAYRVAALDVFGQRMKLSNSY